MVKKKKIPPSLRELKYTFQPLHCKTQVSDLVHGDTEGQKLQAELLELGPDFGRPP